MAPPVVETRRRFYLPMPAMPVHTVNTHTGQEGLIMPRSGSASRARVTAVVGGGRRREALRIT